MFLLSSPIWILFMNFGKELSWGNFHNHWVTCRNGIFFTIITEKPVSYQPILFIIQVLPLIPYFSIIISCPLRWGKFKVFSYVSDTWKDEIIGIIPGMGSANERRRYNVTSALIGWAHTQNDLWIIMHKNTWICSATWYHVTGIPPDFIHHKDQVLRPFHDLFLMNLNIQLRKQQFDWWNCKIGMCGVCYDFDSISVNVINYGRKKMADV